MAPDSHTAFYRWARVRKLPSDEVFRPTAAPVTPLRGLTWDHPRGHAVLDALAALDAVGDETYGQVPVPITWSRQPLEGFESHPISDLAKDYDILVVDHPGLGDAIRSAALLPLEALFSAQELAALRTATIGPSFDSYHTEGRQWALPFDAAAQICVVRPDLLGDDPPPSTWDDVATLASRRPVTLCLAGPHALITVLSLCMAARADRAQALAIPFTDSELIDPGLATTIIEFLTDLFTRANPGLSLRGPVEVLDAMSGGADVACCPLVFGYVTYSAATPGRHRLRAVDAPRWRPDRPPGSVLGGTGLAVSARVIDHGAARAHLRRLTSIEVQTRLAPRVGGQPSARALWGAPQANHKSDDFYRNTLATLEAAWVRPRRPGWIELQNRASAVIRNGLLDSAAAPRIVTALNDIYRRWLNNSR